MVWIGTQDGLNSFDGKNFTVYKPRPNDSTSISDQFILSIQEDNNGFLWIGTRHGLNKLDKRTGRFSHFFVSEKEKAQFQSSYNQVFVKEKNTVLFAKNSQLFRIDTHSEKISSLQEGNDFSYTFIDDNLSLWNFNPEKGIFKTGGIYSKPEKVDKPFSNLFSYGSTVAHDGSNRYHAFATKDAALFIYDKQNLQWLPAIDIGAGINCLYFNKNDSLFAGTQKGIYIIKEGKVIQHIDNNQTVGGSLPPGPVLSVYQDADYNLWAGSASSGFVLYSQNFRNIQIIKPGTENSTITAVAEDEQFIWLGGLTGLHRYGRQTGKITTFPSLTGKSITSVAVDARGKLWVGLSREGLWNMNKDGTIIQQFTSSNSVLATMQILHLAADGQGNVYVSGEVGFYCYNVYSNKWTGIIAPGDSLSGLKGTYILHSYTDEQKNTWLSSNSGVIVYDSDFNFKKIIASHSDTSPINRTLITGITEDKTGIVWIATISKGIYSLDKTGKLVNYNAGNGLASDVISSVEADNKNRVWAATSDGLYIYTPAFKQFFRLTPFDGMPPAAFSNGSMYKSSSGKIYLGSSAGLLIFNADSMLFSNRSITAKIADIKINGASIEKMEEPLVLTAYNKTISFQFGTSEAFQLGNIIYQYKLLGVDKDWQTLPAGSNNISYNNLPYKKLTMQVRAASSFIALENAPVENFTMENAAPFWKTTWFMIASLIAVTGIALFILQQYNNRKYEKQQQWIKAQEQLRNERERIAQDLHDNIGAYAAALITGFSRVETTQQENHHHIDDLKDYASSILSNLRETIWVLHQQTLTVKTFAGRIKNYVFKIAKQYPSIEIYVHEDIETERELSPKTTLNIFRILQEALQNVFKHAGASTVELGLKSNSRLEFYVKDNGNGITQPARDDAYGLKNMQARANDIGFTLSVCSEPGRGTCVTLAENTANAAAG